MGERIEWRGVPIGPRLQGQSVQAGECRLWTGRKVRKGHGRIFYEGRTWATHRVAWVLANGPLPAGAMVLHRCGNAACINAAHLYIGTSLENAKDRDEHGRTARGTRNGRYAPMCPRGHEVTGDNIARRAGRPTRDCRLCERERGRAKWRRMREAAGLPYKPLVALRKS